MDGGWFQTGPKDGKHERILWERAGETNMDGGVGPIPGAQHLVLWNWPENVEETYKDGKLDGIAQLYNKDGKLTYIDSYRDGARLERQDAP